MLAHAPRQVGSQVIHNVRQTKRVTSRIIITGVLSVLAFGCSSDTAPSRPSNVPTEAIWAGGVDGGAWVECRFATKEPFTGFDCQIWNHDGRAWSSGRFEVWMNEGDGGWKPRGGKLFAEVTNFDFYDGVTIVISEKRQLRPRGWIDHPFGNGHGKRVRYADGRRVDEQSY